MLRTQIYVQISPNSFQVRDVSSGRSVRKNSATSFTTTRLLVGNFSEAQATLSKAIVELSPPSLLRRMFGQHCFVMHPLEMTEGGLSEVEERTLSELAEACGANKSTIWLGAPLSDSEASLKAR